MKASVKRRDERMAPLWCVRVNYFLVTVVVAFVVGAGGYTNVDRYSPRRQNTTFNDINPVVVLLLFSMLPLWAILTTFPSCYFLVT